MMATVPHVISGLGVRKFQADGFLLTRVYIPLWHLCTGIINRSLITTRCLQLLIMSYGMFLPVWLSLGMIVIKYLHED